MSRGTLLLVSLMIAAAAAAGAKPAAPAPAAKPPATAPAANPNEVVVWLWVNDGGVLTAGFDSQTFGLDNEGMRGVLKDFLADTRRRKIKAGVKAADLRVVLKADAGVSGKAMSVADAVCRSAGFDAPAWVQVGPDERPVRQLEPAGRPRGGAIGPRGPAVLRLTTPIVFVCDGSAAITKVWPELQSNLASAVKGLKPDQEFAILFYQDGEALPGGDRLAPATPENQRAALDRVKATTARGGGDPLAALRQAFALKPELIYFLAGGPAPDPKAVIAEVRKLNPAGDVKVNTIALVNERRDADEAFFATLTELARANGGHFLLATTADLKDKPASQPAKK